jgi:hypothetical protein
VSLRRRCITLAAFAFGGVFATIAVASTRSGSAPNPPKPADLYISPTGSDSRACTAKAPCASFNRAYEVAKAGQIVEVAAGIYPSQFIKADSTKTGPASVLFRPSAGASVTINEYLEVAGSYLEVRDMRVNGEWNAHPGSHDLVFRNINATIFFITSAANVKVIGGSIGPYENNASQIKSCETCTNPAINILIDGVTFHDYTRTIEGIHMECLHVYPAQNLTIRNTRFRNCAVMDLFLSNYGSAGSLRNITIENNVFDTPGSVAGGLSKGFYPLVFEPFGSPIAGVNVRFNSLYGSIVFDNPDNGPYYSDIRASSNVGTQGQIFCYEHVTYSHNVWESAKCGSTDVKAALGFRDPAKLDLHLVRGARAIGRGDSAGAPSTDIDGDVRPTRVAPDAGADQRETAAIVLGRSIGAVRLGEKKAEVIEFYGTPVRTKRDKNTKAKLTVATYRIRGGNLWVRYDGDTVVGVGTNSLFYSLPNGAGARSPLAQVRAKVPLSWLPCRNSYRRLMGGVAVYVTPAGGKKTGKNVDRILMLRRVYDEPC